MSFDDHAGTQNVQCSLMFQHRTMIGTYNYVFYTNDTTFLSENFEGYIRAMD